jgi:hypothetical protein
MLRLFVRNKKLSSQDYTEEDEMGKACSMQWTSEIYIKQFDRKTSMEGRRHG